MSNIKALDGTAAITIASSTGAVAVSTNVTLGDATTDTVTVNGYMGVGIAPNSTIGLRSEHTALTGSTQVAGQFVPTGTSAATASIRGVFARADTAASAFTVTNAAGFWAGDSTKGAGSTITNQHGLYIADQTQGTNNYGITSLVSSGATKWNIYASGTAKNFFAGDVQLGNGATLKIDDQDSITFGTFSAGTTGVLLQGGTSTSFLAYQAGKERMALGTTEAVFNDAGNDYDFRVESDTSTHALFVQGSDGFVGIGTSSPAARLVVGAAQTCPDPTTVAQFSGTVEICNGVANAYRMQMETDSSTTYFGSNTYYASGWQVFDSGRAPCQIQMTSENLSSHIAFFTSTSNSGNGTEVARVTSDKYLRMASGTGGIQFNGDTAAANALDDYEEGTWTPVLRGNTVNGSYTYSDGYAKYTKIGNQVTVAFSLINITEVSPGTGYIQIAGLPFAKGDNAYYSGVVRYQSLILGGSATSAVIEFIASGSTAVLYLRGIASGYTGIDVNLSGITSGASDIAATITYTV